ncbi:MAG: hypothetical protein IKX41_00090, partial [Oscillospiraceae bacterium]|nr:hypothetical protein [Oscillospiraceae bacterium]
PARADLKNSALKFIHDRCEELGFRGGEETRAEFTGKSSAPGQIPRDMEMDINRLCLERELERFIDSGAADDAYNVYYCYLEMFFGHYGKSKKMVELLSEYESNGSSLLMKHRDHYSHSVYVFALGLAIYERSEAYRRAFGEFYGLAPDGSDPESDRKAARLFLEYWGLTSLFHDVGYPFELPFEQVLSYFEADGVKRGDGCVFIAYRDLDALTKLPEAASKRVTELYGREFTSLVDLLAFDVARTLGAKYGVTERELAATVAAKPVSPDRFGYYMDHAWFSATRLFRELVSSPEGAASLEPIHINALSAILLHNSLFKFAVANRVDAAEAPLPMSLHPLAYLLMLCDELQCWDRIAYGRNSRRELHPSGAGFDFTDGAIRATYYYDAAERDKIEDYERRYAAWRLGGGEEPKLKAYGEMTCDDRRFQRDIERIVDVSPVPLNVVADVRPVDRSSKHTYLSSSSFMHLYDFAVALNARYLYGGNEDKVAAEELEKQFESLSLEYQLSNINQAKSFAGYLNAIGCFYTDKPVDCEEIVKFSPAQTEVFAPMEHRRWVLEHISMGWTYGDEYETVPVPAGESLPDGASMFSERKAYREQMRRHKLTMDGAPTEDEIKRHYDALPETEKGKDYEPFNSMLRLIKKFDGLRIYKLR